MCNFILPVYRFIKEKCHKLDAVELSKGETMKKNFLVTQLLCLLLGCLGAHRYYTGYIGLGILQTLTLGGCGAWALIDFIFISIGKYKDAKGQELEGYDQKIGVGALILVLILALFAMFGPKPKQDSTIINNYSIEKTVDTQAKSDF